MWTSGACKRVKITIGLTARPCMVLESMEVARDRDPSRRADGQAFIRRATSLNFNSH